MKSTKVIVIGFIIILVAYLLIKFALGISPAGLWASFYPLLLAAIHIISAYSLFQETELRELGGNRVFMRLDPLFWGMIGLAFGILGMIAFRLLNDHFTSEKQN
jgi:hypothetical protein